MAQARAAGQTRLLKALEAGSAFGQAGAAVSRIDTHISSIFLVGDRAYKVKRALDLGFLDFSALETRHEACLEELRLNRRLAPDVYLGVVAFRGSPGAPRLDDEGPILEYAVEMRRFPQSALMSQRLEAGKVTRDEIKALAELIAAFHARVPAVDGDTAFGTAGAVRRRMTENLDALPGLMPAHGQRIRALREWSEGWIERLAGVIDRRRREGRVRECHGDLHMENIICWRGRLMAFDGIEFDPDLRWIDVASELAFLTMDLDDRDAPAFARQIRNDYLELTGDYDALRLLGFYQVYRALVRAKINALQAAQGAGDCEARAAGYLALAEGYTARRSPALVLMHGVSGTGKSTLTDDLVRRRGFVRLRSDVVRKQLFGLAPNQSSHDAGLDIYTQAASERTYRRMRQWTQVALESGYSVVLDATFLRREHRRPFEALAEALGIPWHIVALQGDAGILRERVAERQRQGGDPSEADTSVLERQLAERESLTAEERAKATMLRVDQVPGGWDGTVPG